MWHDPSIRPTTTCRVREIHDGDRANYRSELPISPKPFDSPRVERAVPLGSHKLC